ncbi:MAG: tyrosinase [Methylobacteriaceae bacterium]|jgi:tyrosinase|nr:tyrosinase [Methylobacteriaceae bacterium]
MTVQIEIPGTDPQGRVFLTWAPVRATARWDGASTSGSLDIVLRSAGTGGGLVFNNVRSDQNLPTLNLTLPTDGTKVPFWIAGEFQKPSAAYGDAVVQATANGGGGVVGSKSVMVRIRKNAQTLSGPERDRLLAAVGTLNAQGQGAYRDFREMHTNATTREMHGNVGFLPWHRAYVLDLERALQSIDPSVAVPYWRFDEPAPSLFTRDFIGESDPSGEVVFRPGHALEHWVTDGQPGLTRELDFDVNSPANVISEADTFGLGGSGSAYASFMAMEGDPHGTAHTSFGGPISRIGTAVRDPLFFMLHANVDRLWAKWQWFKHRQNPQDSKAFAPANPNKIGHHLADTMWPWNGITGNTRPPVAPGGPFPPTPVTSAPGPTPKVEDMFDMLGVRGGPPLACAYDDVPFELPPALVAGGGGAGPG